MRPKPSNTRCRGCNPAAHRARKDRSNGRPVATSTAAVRGLEVGLSKLSGFATGHHLARTDADGKTQTRWSVDGFRGRTNNLVAGSTPLYSILPLHPSAKLPFEQYSSEKRSWLASSYSRLQPAVTAIERDAVWLAKDPQSTDSTRAAAARLANLLASSYGPSLRGMMLLETDDDLPESLNAKMRALIAQIDSQLALADKANERWLQELDASLKALRTELAAEDRFKDLIVIDTHRSEVARLWRPLRIYARRDQRADHFEDAYLHARRDKLYEVEFLVDGQLQMLARSDVWLNRHESNLPQLLLRQIPSDGPGQPVTATTKLDLEVLCHAARGWQPAHVIDESPFGVEVIWQSTSDPCHWWNLANVCEWCLPNRGLLGRGLLGDCCLSRSERGRFAFAERKATLMLLVVVLNGYGFVEDAAHDIGPAA